MDLVGGRPIHLKNRGMSVGMMTFPIDGKVKNVPNHQPDMACEKRICEKRMMVLTMADGT